MNLKVSLVLAVAMLAAVGCTQETATDGKDNAAIKRQGQKAEKISVRLACPSKKMARVSEGKAPRPRVYSSAGFFIAGEMGFYAEEGLEVQLHEREADLYAIDAVISGQDDFGVGGLFYVLKARSEGHPIVAISSLFQKNPLVILSLKEKGIEKPDDLLGKTLGVYPEGWAGHASFQVFLKETGLDASRIKQLPIYGKGAARINQTDAWVTLITTLPPLKNSDVNIIFFEDYGVLDYKDLIFTSAGMAEKRPDVIKRFLRATLRGWQFVVENPEQTAKVLSKFDPDVDEGLVLESILSYIPMLHTGEVRLGWMENRVWETVKDDLRDLGFIGEVDVDKAYDMRFLQETEGK